MIDKSIKATHKGQLPVAIVYNLLNDLQSLPNPSLPKASSITSALKL
jgi:hypothetical protein